ncbi:hypothetical protein HYFRA_00007645 [Hymenoscyphus fraxineus]|uniref:SnoaL-like domain-containing protein n=1 Tax=Hymenoscyphus fraxineus TaxID=746836 RepID=A0A9N9KRR5_9HELO|nr:hypothetical protein HYFRA_00007645 [Hymenoscyphus fraxineus]
MTENPSPNPSTDLTDLERLLASAAAGSINLNASIQYQKPLSRKGCGPPLIIVVPELRASSQQSQPELEDNERKSPLSSTKKWAEEGFAVVEYQPSPFDAYDWIDVILKKAIAALDQSPECGGEKIGLIVYNTEFWNPIAGVLADNPRIVAAVGYGAYGNETSDDMVDYPIPHIFHFASQGKECEDEEGDEKIPNKIIHEYPQTLHESFADPLSPNFHPSAEAISHSKNLAFLKKHLGGPYFDLEAIWDEHTKFEFGERDVEKTMATMVQEPYVNHIPTMTGGIGGDRLANFYRRHFIFSNPHDTELDLVSRTVGIDRVVDEFVFSFTHTMQIDWLLPGIPPTGRKVRVPFTSVVNVRGDRLYHEHIAWDQASVLVQLGLMPEYLDFPYPLPDGTLPGPGKKFQYRVPAAGLDTAKKLLDKNSVPSNGMFGFKIREVDF